MGSAVRSGVPLFRSGCCVYLPMDQDGPPTVRDVWPQCLMAKDSFWRMANETPLDATIPFKRMDEDEQCVYQTSFEITLKGERSIVGRQLILRMRIERLKCHC